MRGRRDCGNRQRQFSVKDGPMRAARLTHLECALRSSTKILPNSSQNHRTAQRGDLSGCAFQITADREAARANSRFGVGLLLNVLQRKRLVCASELAKRGSLACQPSFRSLTLI
ncbi:hypothetical protein SS50377_27967 [Spironucleus salmonicida]|uniref:Uncharacterized protein n=1 Tax=Spironucleus salmonicida TaxID=348837 RepID=A0A9P8LL04_9EUKA|nr:hypothetical protein SS50377_27967 [Spironucleus salmonicida]